MSVNYRRTPQEKIWCAQSQLFFRISPLVISEPRHSPSLSSSPAAGQDVSARVQGVQEEAGHARTTGERERMYRELFVAKSYFVTHLPM